MFLLSKVFYTLNLCNFFFLHLNYVAPNGPSLGLQVLKLRFKKPKVSKDVHAGWSLLQNLATEKPQSCQCFGLTLGPRRPDHLSVWSWLWGTIVQTGQRSKAMEDFLNKE